MASVLTKNIQLHDIEANWKNVTDFQPEKGRIVVYDPDETHAYPRFKIGTGKDFLTNIPFAPNDNAKIFNVLASQQTLEENVQNIKKTNSVKSIAGLPKDDSVFEHSYGTRIDNSQLISIYGNLNGNLLGEEVITDSFIEIFAPPGKYVLVTNSSDKISYVFNKRRYDGDNSNDPDNTNNILTVASGSIEASDTYESIIIDAPNGIDYGYFSTNSDNTSIQDALYLFTKDYYNQILKLGDDISSAMDAWHTNYHQEASIDRSMDNVSYFPTLEDTYQDNNRNINTYNVTFDEFDGNKIRITSDGVTDFQDATGIFKYLLWGQECDLPSGIYAFYAPVLDYNDSPIEEGKDCGTYTSIYAQFQAKTKEAGDSQTIYPELVTSSGNLVNSVEGPVIFNAYAGIGNMSCRILVKNNLEIPEGGADFEGGYFVYPRLIKKLDNETINDFKDRVKRHARSYNNIGYNIYGKNLIRYGGLYDSETESYQRSITKNGVTVTHEGGGNYIINGTASEDTHIAINKYQHYCDVAGKKFIFSSYQEKDLPVNWESYPYFTIRIPTDEPVYREEYDYNKDGKLDQEDYTYLLYHTTLGGSRYPISDGKIADVDGNGVVDAYDAIELLRLLNSGVTVNSISDKGLYNVIDIDKEKWYYANPTIHIPSGTYDNVLIKMQLELATDEMIEKDEYYPTSFERFVLPKYVTGCPPYNTLSNGKTITIGGKNPAAIFYSGVDFGSADISAIEEQISELEDKVDSIATEAFATSKEGKSPIDISNVVDNSNIDVKLSSFNKIPYPYPSYVLSSLNGIKSGITFKDLGDGRIHASGTAAAKVDFLMAKWLQVDLPAGTYMLSGCPKNGGYDSYYLKFSAKAPGSNTKIIDAADIGDGLQIDAPNGIGQIYLVFRIKSGTSIDLTFAPMLVPGNEIPTDFIPFKTPFSHNLLAYNPFVPTAYITVDPATDAAGGYTINVSKNYDTSSTSSRKTTGIPLPEDVPAVYMNSNTSYVIGGLPMFLNDPGANDDLYGTAYVRINCYGKIGTKTVFATSAINYCAGGFSAPFSPSDSGQVKIYYQLQVKNVDKDNNPLEYNNLLIRPCLYEVGYQNEGYAPFGFKQEVSLIDNDNNMISSTEVDEYNECKFICPSYGDYSIKFGDDNIFYGITNFSKLVSEGHAELLGINKRLDQLSTIKADITYVDQQVEEVKDIIPDIEISDTLPDRSGDYIWLQPVELESVAGATAYIVDTGINEGWIYTKWSNGFCELYYNDSTGLEGTSKTLNIPFMLDLTFTYVPLLSPIGGSVDSIEINDSSLVITGTYSSLGISFKGFYKQA